MKFKEFIGSGPIGIVAGTVTVLLGVGAMAALAFGGSAPDRKPMGDARLSAGGQAFEAALVANAGANDVGRVSRTGSGMADGSPVAGPASTSGNAALATDAGAAGDGSAGQSWSGATAASATMRPGSAAYYRSLIGAGAIGGGMGTLAMLPRGGSARNLAGNLGTSGTPDLVRDDAVNASNPLSPSRAFSSYGANDAGSSGVKRGGQAAVGTSPVGPAANAAPAVGRSTPAATTPAVHMPATPPARASNPPAASSNAPIGVQQTSAAPSATDPLGEHAAPAPGGQAHQPDTPRPPTTSVVGPEAIMTPEPGTWLLVGSGLLALALVGRRRMGQAG